MPLDPAGMIRRFWRAFIRSLASCYPLRPSLLRWQVPPHCQHNCRLFLWLSVGIDRVNTDAVGASLTGISSWYPAPGWTLPLHCRRTPKYSERAVSKSALSAPPSRCPRVSPLSASLTTRIVRPEPTCASFRTGIVRPEPTCKTHCRRRCLVFRHSRMPQRRWSHVTAFPASSRQRPVCPRSFSFRNLLSSSFRSTHGTYTPLKPVFHVAPLGRHTCFEARRNVR
jgi:hypothetical protein